MGARNRRVNLDKPSCWFHLFTTRLFVQVSDALISIYEECFQGNYSSVQRMQTQAANGAAKSRRQVVGSLLYLPLSKPLRTDEHMRRSRPVPWFLPKTNQPRIALMRQMDSDGTLMGEDSGGESSSEEEGEDEEMQDVENTGAAPSAETAPKATGPIVDDDGFTVVQRKGKK